ncbi:MAG: hypothetical protein WCD20_18500 [Rhodomicrobium sp.]
MENVSKSGDRPAILDPQEGVLPKNGALPCVAVTPRMIEAGVYAAREHPLGADLADLVWSVYIAMEAERYDSDSASDIRAAK